MRLCLQNMHISMYCSRLINVFYVQASRVRANFGERPFAYVEGHAHRDAADIEEEEVSMEEMVANFEALPFAMLAGSDSEGEGSGGSGEQEAGSVVELAQTGPPTKKMKTPIATVGKCRTSSKNKTSTFEL